MNTTIMDETNTRFAITKTFNTVTFLDSFIQFNNKVFDKSTD